MKNTNTQELSKKEKARLAEKLCYEKNKEKRAETARKYYLKNKESIKEKNKEYQSSSKLARQAYVKKYKQRNKEVIREYYKKYYEQNKHQVSIKSKESYNRRKDIYKESYKEKYKNNKEKLLLKAKEYYFLNKDRYRKLRKERYEENKEKYKKAYSEYKNKNIDKIRNYGNQYNKRLDIKDRINKRKREKYRDCNNNLKIKEALRGRLITCLRSKNIDKTVSALKLVGCTVQELKEHLERQWLPGMNWNNHTKTGWHIDHIKPCNTFDLSDIEQQKICFHYTNLRPLWSTENLSRPKDGSDIIR